MEEKQLSTKELLKKVVKDKVVAIAVLVTSVVLLATDVIDQKIFKDILMFLLL